MPDRKARLRLTTEYFERRIAYERETALELERLAKAQDIVGFYRLYAEYLEKSNVISSYRQPLLDMARLVVEKFSAHEPGERAT